LRALRGPRASLDTGVFADGAAAMSLIAPSAGRNCIFRISQSAGVWSVVKDDGFYGDYLTRAQAIASACYAARAVEDAGGSAEVRAGPRDRVIPLNRLHSRR